MPANKSKQKSKKKKNDENGIKSKAANLSEDYEISSEIFLNCNNLVSLPHLYPATGK